MLRRLPGVYVMKTACETVVWVDFTRPRRRREQLTILDNKLESIETSMNMPGLTNWGWLKLNNEKTELLEQREELLIDATTR